MKVELYDTTLRDGTQMEGISLSVEDKLKIAQKLDELGIHYIEGGWPGSNPKDAEFFVRAQSLKLANARIAAFGSTRRANSRAEDDPNLRALLDARTPAVTLVGKANEQHVRLVLETTLEENLAMIRDSVAFMKAEGKVVFFDAEHFFDGYRDNPEYALACLRAAAEAGADCLVLCDTNGGTVTSEVVAAVAAARGLGAAVGIHAHNDAGLAVGNSLAAVEAGATHVQGTINGYGERCGNANLISVIATLKLKMGIDCVSDEQLGHLTEISHYVGEVANMVPDPHAPYVGASAFTHKAGIHVAAVVKHESSYQHIDPERVGNEKRVLVSELAGYRNVMTKLKEQGFEFSLSSDDAKRLLELVKQMEARGLPVRRRRGVVRTAGPPQPARLRGAVRAEGLPGRRAASQRAGARRSGRDAGRGGGKGAGRGRDAAHRRRGRWPCERPRPGGAKSAGRILPDARGREAGRLQGAHRRQPVGNGGDRARPHRVDGRRAHVDVRGLLPQYHRGELAGPIR